MNAVDDIIATRARPIGLLCLDVDGVLTDGKLHFHDDGVESKVFNIRDGLGLKLLKDAGIKTALITGRRSPAAKARSLELGIDAYHEGIEDKQAIAAGLLSHFGLNSAQLAYMGDDLPDLPLLRQAGLAISVPDAPAFVRQQVHYVTRARGGDGAVREACELILHSQGKLVALLDRYLA